MTVIKKLYDKIFPNGQKESTQSVIEIYEENKNLIESADTSISNPDYRGILRITAEYGLSLSEVGRSKDSILYLDKAIELLRNDPDSIKEPIYETLVLVRGIENYNLKKYSLARDDFQFVTDNYATDKRHKKWLFAAKAKQLNKYVNYLWFAVLILMAFESLVKKKNAELKDTFLVTATILFILAIIAEIKIMLFKSRIRKM